VTGLVNATGGAGAHDHHDSRERLEYDRGRVQQQEPGGATVPASGRPSRSEEQPEGMRPDALSPQVKPPEAPDQGHAGRGQAAPSAPNRKIQIAPAQLNVKSGD